MGERARESENRMERKGRDHRIKEADKETDQTEHPLTKKGRHERVIENERGNKQ